MCASVAQGPDGTFPPGPPFYASAVAIPAPPTFERVEAPAEAFTETDALTADTTLSGEVG